MLRIDRLIHRSPLSTSIKSNFNTFFSKYSSHFSFTFPYVISMELILLTVQILMEKNQLRIYFFIPLPHLLILSFHLNQLRLVVELNLNSVQLDFPT